MRRVAFLLAVAMPLSASGRTLRVPGDHATIQAAIDAASDGDTVLVRPGEYRIAEPVRFRGKAVTLRGEGAAEETVLRFTVPDGAPVPDLAAVVVFEEGETEASVLEGLVLTGGQGIGLRHEPRGGAVYCSDSSPTIRRCVVRENWASAGGGIACVGDSSPTIVDCAITENGAFFIGGGGVYCGPGSGPLLVGCVIAGNWGRHVGGGLLCHGAAPVLRQCRFFENAGKDSGAALFCTADSAPVLVNCLLARNIGDRGLSWSGVVHCDPGCELGLVNCTMTANTGAAVFCNHSAPVLTNCILWDNNPILIFGDVEPVVRYSCAAGNLWPGEGNINADPLLACPGEYRLRPGSPAIDAGTEEGAPAADIDGVARPVSGGVDIGASESSPDGPAPVCFERGDVNGDAAVDLSDARSILDFLFLGSEGLDCSKSADLQDDGGVNIADPIALLGFLFLGGPPPAPPAGRCGLDSTPDALTCEEHAPCA